MRLEELRSILPHEVTIEDAIPVGDEVALLLSFHGEGADSGVPVNQEMGCLVRVRGGKISRWQPFLSHREALEAAGLRE